MVKRSSIRPPGGVSPIASEASADGASSSENRGGKNPAAVWLGRRGGLKGGKARAAKLTREQRKEIAKRAAMARWHGNGDAE